MIALTVAEKTYQFNPKEIEEAIRLNALETLLLFPGGRRITVEMPRDILFIVFNGRREIPQWHTYKGFRVRAKRRDGNVWQIAINPFEDPDLRVEAYFRSKDIAIFLPPESGRQVPFRIES